MKILWIKSDFPLPADTGGKIRTLSLLKELAKMGEITFLSYIPPDLDSCWLTEMKNYGIAVELLYRSEENKKNISFILRVLSKLTSAKPYIVNKYISPEMIEKIKNMTTSGDYDIVICDFLEMAWTIEHITAIPVVLFEHNVETMIWRRYHQIEKNPLKKLYFSYEKKRMENFEKHACAVADHVLVVSENDGNILQKEFGLNKFTTIPTGVDIEYFQPQQITETKYNIVFCGSMDWMPNIDGFWWFYKEIYPLIKTELPEISFTVVGRRPAEDIINTAQDDESLQVTGTVDDIRPYVAQAELYIVPLRVGGGTRIKIYEAMAMGKCVLSTSIGAEGLPLTNNENITIADNDKEFAKRVIELLRDNTKRTKIAQAGYKLVSENYSWKSAADIFIGSLANICKKKMKKRKLLQ